MGTKRNLRERIDRVLGHKGKTISPYICVLRVKVLVVFLENRKIFLKKFLAAHREMADVALDHFRQSVSFSWNPFRLWLRPVSPGERACAGDCQKR